VALRPNADHGLHHSWGFLDHTQRRITVGRTPLDEISARSRNLYLTTHDTHNRQTSMPPVGFEPTISAGERPQTYDLRPRGHWDRHIIFIAKWIHHASVLMARYGCPYARHKSTDFLTLAIDGASCQPHVPAALPRERINAILMGWFINIRRYVLSPSSRGSEISKTGRKDFLNSNRAVQDGATSS